MNVWPPASTSTAGNSAGGRSSPAPDVLGRVATSRSGRDTGAVYLVVRVEGPTVVFVADGRVRSVARPKRKNVKHLEFGAPAALAERLAAGQSVTDEEIRAAIAAAAVPG